MKQQQVHYFPGHMSKALRELEGFVKVIDLIVEVLDARAPLSSRNPLLDELAPNKPRLLLLSKEDLADSSITNQWIHFFKSKSLVCSSSNLTKEKFSGKLMEIAKPLLIKQREKEAKLGMKNTPIKVMIVGIPNVGKSTLINNLRGKKVAKVGNNPGVTRAEQWIRVGDDFMILDSPGVLPMNYPDGAQAVRLALLGSMKQEVLPNEDLAIALIGYLKENYPNSLKERFDIDNLEGIDSFDVLNSIAKRRGLFEGSELFLTRAANLLLKEFKDGLLGRISIEVPPDAK